jgi:hypothetical protein
MILTMILVIHLHINLHRVVDETTCDDVLLVLSFILFCVAAKIFCKLPRNENSENSSSTTMQVNSPTNNPQLLQNPVLMTSRTSNDIQGRVRQPQISILDQPVSKGKKEASLSSFSFLFSEIVQYCQSRVTTGQELENKLSEIGYRIGLRMLELSVFRDKNSQRQIRRVNMLQYVSNTVWKSLYGKQADALEKAPNMENRYMIYEKDPLENRFVSLPKNLQGMHCSYFTAGIITGCCAAAEFPATVKVYFTEKKDYTVFIVDFDQPVIDRENLLGAK